MQKLIHLLPHKHTLTLLIEFAPDRLDRPNAPVPKCGPAVSISKKLNPSVCGGMPGNVIAALARRSVLPLLLLLAEGGDTGDVGADVLGVSMRKVLASSSFVCTMGRRMQCSGTPGSSSRLGQTRARSGFRAMSEAQTMPMLTSMADHVTACMPDSGGVGQLRLSLVFREVKKFLPTRRPLLSSI